MKSEISNDDLRRLFSVVPTKDVAEGLRRMAEDFRNDPRDMASITAALLEEAAYRLEGEGNERV